MLISLNLMLVSFGATGDDNFDDHLRSFTNCMAGGSRKHHDCHKLRQDLQAKAYPVLAAINLIFLAFQNFASLPFVIQFQTLKISIMQAIQKFLSKF